MARAGATARAGCSGDDTGPGERAAIVVTLATVDGVNAMNQQTTAIIIAVAGVLVAAAIMLTHWTLLASALSEPPLLLKSVNGYCLRGTDKLICP